MKAEGTPDNKWLLALQYMTYIWNQMSLKSNNWVPPLTLLTGQTVDTSMIYQMPYWTYVYYPKYIGGITHRSFEEALGFFVGFSENVGHSLTYKVLTLDTNKIIF